MSRYKTAVCLIADKARHHYQWCRSFGAGLERHGINVTYSTSKEWSGCKAPDLMVGWSPKWRQFHNQRFEVGPQGICVLERGYLGDRFAWTSVCFGGMLNNEADFYCTKWGESDRVREHFEHLVEPWRRGGSDRGFALILAQKLGDFSLDKLDPMRSWRIAVDQLSAQGYEVFVRPHPDAKHFAMRNVALRPPGEPLAAALEGAAVCVAVNSNSAVEAVLSGCSTIMFNRRGMAWPMCSHDTRDPLIQPDRTEWLTNLAWKQWRKHEMESGECWEAINPERAMRAPPHGLPFGLPPLHAASS